MNIEKAILEECDKLIRRQQSFVAQRNAHRRRFEKATGRTGGQSRLTFPHWDVADHFNPFKVKRRVRLAACSIQHRLEAGTYSPRPALIREIKKPDGSKRPLAIFPVADAALGTVCFRRIATRNQHRLSPFSYAFRRDIGVHEAIESLTREIEHRNRFWVVEFDFAKYFDTISHEYILNTIPRYFKVTATEQQVLRATLRSQRAFGHEAYRRGNFSRTDRGVPQGNSLSLFLANVACHELDLSLSRTSATFARYADDILLLCKSSAEADDVTELVLDHCKRAGLSVNFEKSDGISRFGPEYVSARHTNPGAGGKAELDYLGYRFAYRSLFKRSEPARKVVRRISIRPRSFAKVKGRLAKIIFCHLLLYPRRGLFAPSRVDVAAGIDWDVVTCINDLRDYLYGGLPEDELRAALSDRSVRLHLNRGVFAFYPLVNDVEQLKALDGWLANAIKCAVAERSCLLAGLGLAAYPALGSIAMLRGDWYDHTLVPIAAESGTAQTIKNDVRLPSLVRAWKYSRRCLNAFNLGAFPFRDLES